MSKERFTELCHEVQVQDPGMIDHIWTAHRPPEEVSEEEVRQVVPRIVEAEEAAAELAVLLLTGKVPAA